MIPGSVGAHYHALSYDSQDCEAEQLASALLGVCRAEQSTHQQRPHRPDGPRCSVLELMAPPSNRQSRQVTSYPSPQSYPSPSMAAYAYPLPSQSSGGNAEPYRASPESHVSVSLHSLNLPPIRNHLDARSPISQPAATAAQHTPSHPPQHPHAPPTGSQTVMGSPLAPPMGQYYPNPQQSLAPPPPHMNVTSDPNQPLRFPIPVTDNRMMSGGRNKKEIKRRTKTGCLTCRKRRIKVCIPPPSVGVPREALRVR